MGRKQSQLSVSVFLFLGAPTFVYGLAGRSDQGYAPHPHGAWQPGVCPHLLLVVTADHSFTVQSCLYIVIVGIFYIIFI